MTDCKHARVLHVNAKADDRQEYRVPHLGIDREGYAPRIGELCHGDYIEFTVCLDCGTVVGLDVPMSDEMIFEAFDLHPDDPGGEDDDLLDALGR
jgi:hypothetical protein